MKPENKAILDKNRSHHLTATKAGFVKGFNAREKEELLRVMREEFQPGYTTDMWCSPCIFDFIKLIYKHYDAWLEAQPKEEPAPESKPETTLENIHASFPKADPPQNSNNELHPPHSGHRPKRHARRK
jgi:hypothetical protein